MAAAEGAADGRVRDCVEIWRGAGFTAEAFDDAQSMIWGKMLGNIAFSAVSTVTGLRLGQVVSNPEAFALSCACVEEAAALARVAAAPPLSGAPRLLTRWPWSRSIPPEDVERGSLG